MDATQIASKASRLKKLREQLEFIGRTPQNFTLDCRRIKVYYEGLNHEPSEIIWHPAVTQAAIDAMCDQLLKECENLESELKKLIQETP